MQFLKSVFYYSNYVVAYETSFGYWFLILVIRMQLDLPKFQNYSSKVKSSDLAIFSVFEELPSVIDSCHDFSELIMKLFSETF